MITLLVQGSKTKQLRGGLRPARAFLVVCKLGAIFMLSKK